MSIIGEFFSKAVSSISRAPNRSPAADPVNQMRGYMLNGIDGYTAVNYDQIFKASNALRHPAIFRCVDKIAAAVQEAHLVARKIHPVEGVAYTRQDATTKQLQAVLDNPCETFNALQLKYWASLNMSLYGQFFLKIGRSSNLLPNAIYPLQTQNTTILFNKNGSIKGYRIRTANGNTYSDLPSRRAVEAEEQARANLGNAWGYNVFRPSEDVLKQSNSPLSAATMPADIISLLMQRAKDTASGHPNVRYLVTTDATVGEDQENSVIEMFEKAKPDGEKSGQVGFISGTAVKVIELNNQMMDIHTKIPSDDMFRMVGAIFGVPMALLGISSADGAKFASNFVESRLAFIQDTVIPSYLHPIEQGLTEALCPPGYEIKFDRDGIQALNDERVNKMLKLKDIPFITDQEKRMACDYPAEPIHGTLPPTPSNFTKPTADGLPPAEGVNGGGSD